MTLPKSRAALLAFLAAPASIALFAACVGDVADVPADSDAATTGDGAASGGDATVDDATGGDTGVTDGGSADTGPAMDADDGAPCNLNAPFGFPTNVTELNTAADETFARISADGKTIYLSRNAVVGNFFSTMQLYQATRSAASGPFSAPTLIATVGSGSGDISPAISADGTSFYFDSYRSGTRHIYGAADTTPGNFGTPTILPSGVTSGFEDYNPYPLPNNSALYFSSNRTGASKPGSNLWRANRLVDGGFGVPQEEAALNFGDKDESPVVTPDDLTIFSGSDRLADGGAGFGSFDIYVAHRASAGAPWNAPTRVNELSSNNAEYPTSITTDGCTMYFMSDRQDIGPQGRFDIYRATRGK